MQLVADIQQYMHVQNGQLGQASKSVADNTGDSVEVDISACHESSRINVRVANRTIIIERGPACKLLTAAAAGPSHQKCCWECW